MHRCFYSRLIRLLARRRASLRRRRRRSLGVARRRQEHNRQRRAEECELKHNLIDRIAEFRHVEVNRSRHDHA